MKTLFENLKLIVVILSIPIWLNAGASCARANAAEAKYRIAIIDSGYDARLIADDQPKLKLCKTGHYDFAAGKAEVGYMNRHGTDVAAIIAMELKDVDYCAVIFQAVSRYESPRYNLANVIQAYTMAGKLHLVAINESISGVGTSVAEREAMRVATETTNVIFVAAGNNGKNLDYECDVFPACFDLAHVYAVGALNADQQTRLKTSNYGKRIKVWFKGTSGLLTGTSYAVPRALSKFVKKLSENQKTLERAQN